MIRRELAERIPSLPWYHTLDLGEGLITPGEFDHRPHVPQYGLPDDLKGKSALDVGTANGFFAFEMERRGARVTAIDLPGWFDHDFGPCYQSPRTADEGQRYMREPFALASAILGSRVRKIEMSVYDLSPESVGTFDLVFCGSLLLHLTDPLKALWRIRSVTRELAIIATVIHPMATREPLALYVGHDTGACWWFPNQACLEKMVESAGFEAVRLYSEVVLRERDTGVPHHHGVVHGRTHGGPSGVP